MVAGKTGKALEGLTGRLMEREATLGPEAGDLREDGLAVVGHK
jgi:hypothetical protein